MQKHNYNMQTFALTEIHTYIHSMHICIVAVWQFQCFHFFIYSGVKRKTIDDDDDGKTVISFHCVNIFVNCLKYIVVISLFDDHPIAQSSLNDMCIHR